MTVGERVRQLRKAKGLSLLGLAPSVGVGFAYLSLVETGRLTYGDYPSRPLIRRLAEVLDADGDELLLLAGKIPEKIKQRVLERPQAFRRFADLDDVAMDLILAQLDRGKRK